MASELEAAVFGDEKDELDADIEGMSNEDLLNCMVAVDNEIRIMKSDISRIKYFEL